MVPEHDRISLTGKNVLVIGGSKGNGKAIAERFAVEGANIIATSRHPECYPPPAAYRLGQVDVRFEGQVGDFLMRVARDFGNRIDILVNCAKTLWLGPLAEATGNDLANNLANNLATDLVGYHRVTHYALPLMRHSDETRVISMGSLSAYVQVAFVAGGYSMAKRGLQNWNDTMQVEELIKKALGLIQFGPTFSLLEPFDNRTALGLAEYDRASQLSASHPLLLGARFAKALDLLKGIEPAHVAELVLRVAVAPQPGVRHAAIREDQTLPDGTPLLPALQALNAASADEALNYFAQPFNALRLDPAYLATARAQTLAAFAPQKASRHFVGRRRLWTEKYTRSCMGTAS